MQKRVVEPQADETRTESKVTARAEPSTTHVYKFDRLRNGTKMAEGATISRCSSPEDAQKEAAKLFGNHPYESFVLQEVDGQPVNEPRAEPSRGAADAERFYDDVYDGDNGCELFPPEVAAEAFLFAEAYAKSRHVVLLEALRSTMQSLDDWLCDDTISDETQSEMLTLEDEILKLLRKFEAEAAIQQAERT